MVNASLNLILEAIQKGICILDENGFIVATNSTYLNLVNYTPEQMIGRNINEFSANKLYLHMNLSNIAITMPSGLSIISDITPIVNDNIFHGAVLLVKDDKELRSLNEQLQSANATIDYLEKKLTEKKESGWYSGRMKSQSQEDKIISMLKSGKIFEKFIGMSPKVLDALALAAKAAKVQSTVLIRGDSGTGKELVAEGIHLASQSAKGPFIRVNCAAIPENLLESEFFGHEKGAFTGAIKKKLGKFELAHKGTIFLDEIGEMELSMQTKLLRVLQCSRFERVGGENTIEVDVRVVAATNRNMEQMVKDNLFREDLYYRLNVIPIYLPSLKERKEDIPLLVDFFLKQFSEKFDKQILGIRKAAMDILVNYHWPGNVRELQNIIERIVVLSDGLYIEVDDIPSTCYIKDTSKKNNLQKSSIELSSNNDLFPLADYEKEIIKLALEKYGSFTAAGKVLGITHKTVAAKAQKYGIIK